MSTTITKPKRKAQLVTELVVSMAPKDKHGQAMLAIWYGAQTKEEVQVALDKWRGLERDGVVPYASPTTPENLK